MQLIRGFETLDVKGNITGKLEILDVMYARYKKTNSTGIIVRTHERNLFHAKYFDSPLIKEFTYIPIFDRNGHRIRLRQTVTASDYNFVIIPNIKSCVINKDWLPYHYTAEYVDFLNKKLYNCEPITLAELG